MPVRAPRAPHILLQKHQHTQGTWEGCGVLRGGLVGWFLGGGGWVVHWGWIGGAWGLVDGWYIGGGWGDMGGGGGVGWGPR